MNKIILQFLTVLYFFSCSVLAQDEITIIVEHYIIEGEIPLDEGEVSNFLSPYTGQEITLKQVQKAVQVLQNKLRESGYGFYQVKLMPQTLDNKQVVLSVKSLIINKININLNKTQALFFSTKNIRNSIPELQYGYSPNLNKLGQQVELANLNQAKEVNIQFSISEKVDNQIDADIAVNANRTSNYFSWLDNTGNDETGNYRLGIGYKQHNLWDKDHQLSVSFVSSPGYYKEVQQYGISYQMPFYQQSGIWQLYTYYSDVDSGTVAENFNVSGKGLFFGTKYQWYLPRVFDVKKYTHQLVFGLDDKLFKNNVFFANEPLGVDIRSTPLSISYRGKWKKLSSSFQFYLQYEHNLKLGNYNNDYYYSLNRNRATSDWDLIKMGFTFVWLDKGYRLFSQFDYQYTDQELISGEQFGIGGMNSKLRGFNEREVSGDKGIKGNLELWSPRLWKNQINLIAFLDSGYVSQINPLADEMASDILFSTGVGIVWHWKQHLSLSVYLAHVLDGNDSNLSDKPTKTGNNAIQFLLYINY